jgi:antitoxin ParD1/3/4
MSELAKPRPPGVKAFCLAKLLRVTDPRSAQITTLDGSTGLTFISAMTVTLTAEQKQFVAEQLKNGHYRSASDVIAQSLGMLRDQEEFIRTNTAKLREKIATGLEQIRHGETVDGPTALRNLRAKLLKPDRA